MRTSRPPIEFVILALALIAAAAGCDDALRAPGRLAEVRHDPAPSEPAPDESFTTAEYVRRGLPEPDRPWSIDDLVQAKEVLESVAREGCQFLPRYQSERSGEVFARLTSPENLKPFLDPDLPLIERSLAAQFLQAHIEIINVYSSTFPSESAAGSEIEELIGFELQTTVVMLEVVDEIAAAINLEDPTYEQAREKLLQMKQSGGGLVTGCLVMLTERQTYPIDARVRLVGHMRQAFPKLIPRFPPEARVEALDRLATLQGDPDLKELQPGLDELHSIVSAIVNAQ
jgi:hypothetical protein